MGAALCTGLGSPDFILEATRMAGIFSRGFGFPSTSLEAAAAPRVLSMVELQLQNRVAVTDVSAGSLLLPRQLRKG